MYEWTDGRIGGAECDLVVVPIVAPEVCTHTGAVFGAGSLLVLVTGGWLQ